MKYQDPQLRRVLAAEYALGTLRGPARVRFERLVRADAAWQAELRFWERRLGQLAPRVPQVAPAETVWIGLERRIDAGNTAPLRRAQTAVKIAPSGWRIAAGLATAAAVVVAVLLTQPKTEAPPQVASNSPAAPAPVAPPVMPPVAPAPSYVALLKMPKDDMQWTVSLTPAHGHMTVAAVGTSPQLRGRSAELWWLSPKGPVALGVLPLQGGGDMSLPAALADAKELKLAISIEPPGGSPTGQPTGPVVASAIAVQAA